MAATASRAIKDLLTSYHELNADFVDELADLPTPLEFMRYVATNRPFVVRGAISHWPAISRWNENSLKQMMGSTLVEVAVTPQGNADSIVENHADGLPYLAMPHKIQEPFDDFLDHVIAQEKHWEEGNVRYAQTQNDNLRDEYLKLVGDVEQDIPWARIALDKTPDAINLWIGNSKSVTALHRDNYENIYCQLVVVPEIPPRVVRFATWDPDKREKNTTPFSSLSRPLRVTLNPGDLLYLPALWYHKVSQSCSTEAFCCSVNFWYDMDYAGSFHPMNEFLQAISSSLKGDNVDGAADF